MAEEGSLKIPLKDGGELELALHARMDRREVEGALTKLHSVISGQPTVLLWGATRTARREESEMSCTPRALIELVGTVISRKTRHHIFLSHAAGLSWPTMRPDVSERVLMGLVRECLASNPPASKNFVFGYLNGLPVLLDCDRLQCREETRTGKKVRAPRGPRKTSPKPGRRSGKAVAS